MIGDETIGGKKIFDVGFLDFYNLVTRTKKRTRFLLNNKTLMEYVSKNRYTRKFIFRYSGVTLDAEFLKHDSTAYEMETQVGSSHEQVQKQSINT